MLFRASASPSTSASTTRERYHPLCPLSFSFSLSFSFPLALSSSRPLVLSLARPPSLPSSSLRRRLPVFFSFRFSVLSSSILQAPHRHHPPEASIFTPIQSQSQLSPDMLRATCQVRGLFEVRVQRLDDRRAGATYQVTENVASKLASGARRDRAESCYVRHTRS